MIKRIFYFHFFYAIFAPSANIVHWEVHALQVFPYRCANSDLSLSSLARARWGCWTDTAGSVIFEGLCGKATSTALRVLCLRYLAEVLSHDVTTKKLRLQTGEILFKTLEGRLRRFWKDGGSDDEAFHLYAAVGALLRRHPQIVRDKVKQLSRTLNGSAIYQAIILFSK